MVIEADVFISGRAPALPSATDGYRFAPPAPLPVPSRRVGTKALLEPVPRWLSAGPAEPGARAGGRPS